MNWLGLDIGGANLKVASTQGYARSLPYPLWKKPNDLGAAIRQLIREAPFADGIATTMTGELADCFESKREGVLHILKSVEDAVDTQQVCVYQIDGEFVSIGAAHKQPLLSAASNWHASARFASRFVSHFPSILIDIGSTTTDIIPIASDGPLSESTTDTDRLRRGELVYIGISRTPITAITQVLPYQNELCPVASEFFATTSDVAVLLNFIPEQFDNVDTADGRPLTKSYSRDRLARMICADRETFDERHAIQAAQFAWDQLSERIASALRQVAGALPAPLKSILVCGSGELIASEAVRLSGFSAPTFSLGELIGADLSNVAPAYAVAVLASEWSAKR